MNHHMVTVVKIGLSTLKVRSDLAVSVSICWRCKGFRTITKMLRCGGGIYLTYDIPCPNCGDNAVKYNFERRL